MINDHKKLKKTLINYQIITSFDYIRTFDENYWTDFSINKVTQIVNSESKYLLVGLSKKDSKPFVLYNPSLENTFNEISEKMIKKQIIKGYSKERNRVIGYYEGNGIIRFGNKSSIPLKIKFELANLEDIIRKKHYMYGLTSKNRHHIIQSYLLSLGESLGYTVKVAKNDKKSLKKIIDNLLIVKNIHIPNLETRTSKNMVELIDVIWMKNNKVIVAFEVEFSNNYSDAFKRLFELNSLLEHQNILNIIVSKDENFYNLSSLCNSNYVKYLFPKNNLYFLPLSKLNDCLILKDILGFNKKIENRKKHFYSQTTLHNLLNK